MRATHQLVVADGEVCHLAPAHWHHIKAAVRLPTVHTQRVHRAAEQTAPIRAECYTPEYTHTQMTHTQKTAKESEVSVLLTAEIQPLTDRVQVSLSHTHTHAHAG